MTVKFEVVVQHSYGENQEVFCRMGSSEAANALVAELAKEQFLSREDLRAKPSRVGRDHYEPRYKLVYAREALDGEPAPR